MMHAALDLSGTSARLAFAGTDGEVRGASRPMKGRDSAHFAGWVAEHLDAWGAAPEAVTHWTVGAGPGSFTGLRLAAALVAGIAARREGVLVRCVPTAAGWAAGMDGRVQVVYDGRNAEVIVYELENGVPTGLEAVLNAAAAPGWFEGHPARRIAPAGELEAIGKVVAAAGIVPAESCDMNALLASQLPWDNDLTRLVYIRPAVYTNS